MPLSASLFIDPRQVVGDLDRRVFGSFVEHMGRCVYTGIYEPEHSSADSHGFDSASRRGRPAAAEPVAID